MHPLHPTKWHETEGSETAHPAAHRRRGLDRWWLPCLLLLLLVACGSKQEAPDEQVQVEEPKEHLWVRHILIRKAGAPGAGPETRTRAGADSLAQALLQRIQAGENFRALAKEFSEDPSSVDGGEIAPLEPDDAVR